MPIIFIPAAVLVIGILLFIADRGRNARTVWWHAAWVVGATGLLLYLVAGVSAAIDYSTREAAGLPFEPAVSWILILAALSKFLLIASFVISAVLGTKALVVRHQIKTGAEQR